MEFTPFPKIPRIARNIVITEKIDGTNAQITIAPIEKMPEGHEDWPSKPEPEKTDYFYGSDGSCWGIWTGSRNRWVQPGNDNFGFAKWVAENKEELKKLGPGQHFGEWWGQGIQRGYNLKEKRFSLFNAGRWNAAYQAMREGHENAFPKCCHVVPILGLHTFDVGYIDTVMAILKEQGSAAAPGYMNPEGIIIYHTQSKQMYKKTFEMDDTGKGE